MTHPEDEQLWADVRSGDPRAFETLFDRYADLIYNFAFRRTGSWDTAEEVVSMVFLEAWRQRLQVTTLNGSIRPWLIGVAVNLIRRHWRSAERRRRAFLRLVAFEPVDADHAGDVSDRLYAEQQMRRILDELDDLPNDQREVLELWAFEELSYEDIAAALEIPVGTVRSRLHRARQRLQPHGTRRPHRVSTGDSQPSTVIDCQVCGEGEQS